MIRISLLLSNLCCLFLHDAAATGIREYGKRPGEHDAGGENTNNGTLPATGSGLEYASRCNAAKQTWVSSRGREFVSLKTFNRTTPWLDYSTIYTTSTSFGPNTTPYTLCDGFPRIDGGRTLTSTKISTPTVTTLLDSTSVFVNLTQPTCIINSHDCAVLKSSYSGADAAFSRIIETQDESKATAIVPIEPSPPICGLPTITPVTSAVGQAQCAMQDASVQLLYWPVTASCDPCHRDKCSTTTMGPTISGKPNTFVTRNTTFTSPTVYIDFEGSWAYTRDGRTFTNPQRLIVPMSSSAVSSHCAKLGGGYGRPEPVNYANFNKPVPASAYRCQPKCFMNPQPYSALSSTITATYSDLDDNVKTNVFTRVSSISAATANLCSTIWEDDYAPVLAIPEAFKTIKPAGFVDADLYGENNPCQFIFNENAVLFDPPLALTEASSAAKPTLPSPNNAQPTPTDPVQTASYGGSGPTLPKATAESQVLPTASPSSSAEAPQETAASRSMGDVIASVMGLGTPVSSLFPGKPSITVAGSIYTADSASQFIVNDQTLAPAGPPVTVDGNTLSLAPSGTALVINGQTSPIKTPQNNADRWTLSLPTEGSELVINGATTTAESHTADLTETADVGTIELGRHSVRFTRAEFNVQVDGMTLSASGKLVQNGQTMSVLSDLQIIRISGTVTSTVTGKPTTMTSPKGGEIGEVTLGDHTVSFTEVDSVMTIAKQTLTPGGSIVIDGSTLSDSKMTTTTTTRPGKQSSTGDIHTTTSDAARGLTLLTWQPLLLYVIILALYI